MPATAVAPATPFEFRCLGPVVLARRGGERLRLRTRKQLALLLLLARRQGLPVSRDDLIALLWSEDGESNARHSLSQSISLINKVFGTDAIEPCQKNQLLLRDGTVWLDVAEFEGAIADGRSADAQALWRGGLFEGQWIPRAPNFERWLTDERDRLARQLGAALREVLEAHRTAGDWQPMRKVAEALLDVDALDEGAMLAYLEALALHGERTLALRRYGEFERRLREELDAEPGSALRGWIKRHRKGDGDRPVAVPVLRVSDLHVLPAVRPVYGRQEEFALLWERWETAQRSGEGTFLIMQGEAGIGKSALAGKLLNQVHVGGGSVCLARCYRTEKSVPFAPITALIRQLSRLPGFVALGDVWIGELTRLVPELRQRFPNAPQPMAIDESARHRLSDGVVQATECVADEQPLLVVVDDIQDADEASLALLHYLGRSVATQPIFLLCIARSGVQLSEFERTFFDTARAAGLARFVTIGALSDEHIARIAQQVFAERGLEVPETAIERVRRMACGNPLHAIEAALGAPTQDGQLSNTCVQDDLPTADMRGGVFERTALERFAGLSSQARLVASVLAIAARPFSEYDLAAVTEMPPGELAAAIQSLEEEHFIRRIGSNATFTHEQYGRSVNGSIESRERARIHERIAATLSCSASSNPAARYEVALHLEGAGRPEESLKEALAAADHAASVGALRERATALALADRVARSGNPAIALALCDSLLTLQDYMSLLHYCRTSRCLNSADLRSDNDYYEIAAGYDSGALSPIAACAQLQSLLGVAPREFSHKQAAQVLLVRVSDKAGNHSLAIAVARTMRHDDRPGPLSYKSLFATAFVFSKYYWAKRAVDAFRKGLLGAQRARDYDYEQMCREGLGISLKQIGRLGESLEQYQYSLALARRLLKPQAEAMCLQNVAVTEMSLGNFQKAAARLEEAARFDALSPGWPLRVFRLYNRAILHLLEGDAARARDRFEESREVALLSGMTHLAMESCGGIALAAQRLGTPARLQTAVKELEALAATAGSLHYNWVATAAKAWNTLLVENEATRAISLLQAEVRRLERRDVPHWLSLELELLRLRETVQGAADPDSRKRLLTACREHDARGIELAAVHALER